MHKVIDYADMIGFAVKGLTYSPVKGPEGNIEYLLWLEKRAAIAEEVSAMTETEALGALHQLLAQESGISHQSEMRECIRQVIAEAHDKLDEAK